MKSQEYLDIVTKQVRYIFDREYIEAELKEHLEDSIHDLMEEGLSYEEAEEQAVLQMGNPIETGKMLNKEHHPVMGYLYALSNVLIVVLGIYFVLTIGIVMWGLMENANPIIERNCIASYPINLEVKIPTHRVKIDNICLLEDGRYSLTSCSWKRFSYSRAGWSISAFKILDTDGEWIEGGSGGSFGGITQHESQGFKWPDNDIIVLEFKDGQRYQLNLKEYVHE
jgi:hypothetical protein